MNSIKDPGLGLLDVTYPIAVKYCGNCSMPIEYCEFYSEYDKCKEWLAVGPASAADIDRVTGHLKLL